MCVPFSIFSDTDLQSEIVIQMVLLCSIVNMVHVVKHTQQLICAYLLRLEVSLKDISPLRLLKQNKG